LFSFEKTVNVTNLKNVLCQIPKAVVSDWGLKVGDTLELIYKDGEITIKPHVQRGSGLIKGRD
jgi:AbrB family looped-hinge helix DNA binding protein